jgi:putative two-component system response regulator
MMMPGIDGIETCKRLSVMSEMEHSRIIILSARNEIMMRMSAYDAGAVDYISKPFHGEEVLTKVRTWMKTLQTREVNKIWCDLEEARDGIGRTLTSLVELRDTETGEHLFRMRWYSQVLAEQLSVSGPYQNVIDSRFLKQLYRASPLHDIGKIAVDDAILRKPGWLTPEEYEEIKKHTIAGHAILELAAQNLPYADYLPMATKIARHHHERFDGSGYPDGLREDEIPLSARVVSVADVFDAITSDRVYRKAMSLDQAVGLIRKGAGKMFDPAIVEAFHARLDDIKQGQMRFHSIELAPPPRAEVFGSWKDKSADDPEIDHREHDLIEI